LTDTKKKGEREMFFRDTADGVLGITVGHYLSEAEEEVTFLPMENYFLLQCILLGAGVSL
jgi:hypothetical protein